MTGSNPLPIQSAVKVEMSPPLPPDLQASTPGEIMKIGTYILAGVLLTGPMAASVEAQEPQATSAHGANRQGPKLRLVITDLDSTALKNPAPPPPTDTVYIPPPTEFARGITEMLTTALVKSGHFVVLERTSMDKVTAEQDLATGGRVNAETAAKTGRIIGAQAIITGDITEFSYSVSGYTAGLGGLHGLGSKLSRKKVTARVTIDLRIVDALTGQVIAAEQAQGRASMANASADLSKGKQDFGAATGRETPLGEATRQALDKIVDAVVAGMKDVPWSARVIDVRDGVVYINAGASAGIAAGTEFEVFHSGEPLIDPETGRTLGSPESPAGSIVVEKVQDSFSTARMNSGGELQRGDVVRLKK